MIRKVRKLLDAEFYLRTNPDVVAARMDPFKHYVKYGAAERRQPHPLFDCDAYLRAHPDAGNPLVHYSKAHSKTRPRSAEEGSQFGQC